VLYDGIEHILFDKDISYAALEFPISYTEPEKTPLTPTACPSEYCNPAQFDVLKGHKGKNFTILHTASNHMFDIGAQGVETTRKVLHQANIIDVGTNGTSEDSGKAKIIIKNSIKIGFASAGFGLNGYAMPSDESYHINYARLLPNLSYG